VEASAEPIPIAAIPEEEPDETKITDDLFSEFLNAAPTTEADIFSEQDIRRALEQFPSVEGPEPVPEPAVVETEIRDQNPIEEFPTGFAFSMPAPAPEPAPNSSKLEEGLTAHVNEMFADIMEESGAIADREAAKESFEDHFSLGMAYRDMELADEAIREFEIALKVAERQKDNGKIIQCCGMLSTSCLKKGMGRTALKWCQKGLSLADISSHEAMALRYDMGVAHSISGSRQRALECFDEVFGLDPEYRDVSQKIDDIKGGFERHAP
jgi:tetratricopeptide (TPR) repeat protein